MIRKLSNKTTNPMISIENKMVKVSNGVGSIVLSNNGKYTSVNQNYYWFIKLTFLNLDDKETLSEAKLVIESLNQRAFNLKVFSLLNQDFSDSSVINEAVNFSEAILENEIRVGVNYPSLGGVTLENSTIDITNIVKGLNKTNNSVMFLITNNVTGTIELYDYEYLSTQNDPCVSGFTSSVVGLDDMAKFDEIEFGPFKGYVNLNSLELVGSFKGLQSANKNVPINVDFIYNTARRSSYLKNMLSYFYDYKLTKENNIYIFEDPTGFKRYYNELNKASLLLLKYGIKHSLEHNGKLYFSEYDMSYLYESCDSNNKVTSVTYYDKNDNSLIFNVFNSNLLISQSIDNKGNTIWYVNMTDNLVEFMNLTESVIINHNYESGLDESIQFYSPDRCIKFDYTNGIRIKFYDKIVNDITDENLIASYHLLFDSENKLTQIIDEITLDNIQFAYSLDKIETIELYSNNTLVLKKSYIRETGYAKVTTNDRDEMYYYFDNFGRCILEMDNKLRSVSYEYGDYNTMSEYFSNDLEEGVIEDGYIYDNKKYVGLRDNLSLAKKDKTYFLTTEIFEKYGILDDFGYFLTQCFTYNNGHGTCRLITFNNEYSYCLQIFVEGYTGDLTTTNEVTLTLNFNDMAIDNPCLSVTVTRNDKYIWKITSKHQYYQGVLYYDINNVTYENNYANDDYFYNRSLIYFDNVCSISSTPTKLSMMKNLLSKSNVQYNERAMFENHSFDQNNFNNASGWYITCPSDCSYEIVDVGVDSGKCLKFSLKNNKQCSIWQKAKVFDTVPRKVRFFAKTDSNTSTILQVRVYGQYYVDEEKNGLLTPIKKIYDYQTSFIVENNWNCFETYKLRIPEGGYNSHATVYLSSSGDDINLYIDELSLDSDYTITRSNLISNADLGALSGNIPQEWVLTDTLASDIVINGSDDYMNGLGTKMMKFSSIDSLYDSNNNIIARTISQTIDVCGNKDDAYLFNVFGKVKVTDNQSCYGFVKFYYDDEDDYQNGISFKSNVTNWQEILRSVTAEKQYHSIEVGITYSGIDEAIFTGFSLYKEDDGSYFAYDDRENLIESMNSDSFTKYEYNKNNKLNKVVSSDGSRFIYNYYENNRLKSVEDIYGNTITYTYDNNGYITSTSIITTNVDENTLNLINETITTRQTSDRNGILLSSTDFYGKVTSYSNDLVNKKEVVVNPKGHESTKTFDRFGNLIRKEQKLGSHTYYNKMNYDSRQSLISANQNDTGQFNFTYDQVGNMTGVNVGNDSLLTLTYNSILYNTMNRGLLSQEKYDSNNIYKFTYDSNDRMISVVYNSQIIYEYYYDEKGNVVEIKDRRALNNTYYFYDNKNNLIQTIDNKGNSINYLYDNLGNIQTKIYDNNGTRRMYNYEYEYEYNEYSKEGYISRIETLYGDEVVVGGNGGDGTYGAYNTGNVIEEYDPELQMNVYKFANSKNDLTYDVSTFNSKRSGIYSNKRAFSYKNWLMQFNINKTFYMWVKPTGTNCQYNLFTFNFSDDKESCLRVNTNGIIEYKNASTTISLGKNLKLNEWNLIGVKLSHNYPTNSCNLSAFINGEYSSVNTVTDKVYLLKKVSVCKQTSTKTLSTKICLLSFGAFDYNENIFKGIYNEGLKYLTTKVNKKNNGMFVYSLTAYEGMDMIPLNGTFRSLDGLNPIEYISVGDGYRSDKAKLFKYDVDADRHVYGSYSSDKNMTLGSDSKLTYKLPLKESGTLAMRFKPDGNDSGKRAIFTTQSSGIERMGIYFDTSNVIYIVENGNLKGITGFITINTWHSLVLSYDSSGYKLYIDGMKIHSSSYVINLTDAITYFGCTPTSIGTILNGMIEMVAYTSDVLNDTRVMNLSNSVPLVIRDKKDNLGRVKSKEINLGNRTLQTKYTYDKMRVQSETKPNGDIYSYTYDELGNIVEIYKNGSLITKYTYDELNRLIIDTDYITGTGNGYTYDDRGNIVYLTSSTDKVISYCTEGLKDRIKTVNDINGTTTFNYDNEYTGNPSSVTRNNITTNFTWEGTRLTKIGDNITYYYNNKGIRTKKVVNSLTTSFVLEDTNIIRMTKEVSNTSKVVLDFIYDEKGVLQGVIESGNLYFYERDITNRITKIIDINNTPMVEYSYNSWGVVTKNILVNCNVSNHNPFMYKGYYYDEETQLFYCNSRYYSPELCRWISPDSIEYLDPESINGLNLYCYCYNNPISYSDPSGNLPQWAEWLIGGAVIVGLGIATIFTGGAAGVILGAAFYGAVTSAAGGALVGGIIGGITGGWEGAFDGAASGFMWGAISGAVTGALTSGINIATGSVQIVGSAQKTGSLFHQFASNVQAGKMSLAVGRYSEIHLNRSKGLGIKGFRPDVTGVTKNGLRVVEVVSSSQTYASQVAKVGRMMGQYSHISNGLTLDALRFITSWFVF